jgi:hypothetical protein
VDLAHCDAHDDYSAIMFKAIADRLAEAFAECLHFKVRTDWWGYERQDKLDIFDLDAMISERYRGIRPAPDYKRWLSYSACWHPTCSAPNRASMSSSAEALLSTRCRERLVAPPSQVQSKFTKKLWQLQENI